MIPEFMHTQGRVLHEIINASEIIHNNMDLGETVRVIIKNYKDGKYTPPSNIVLDKPPFTEDYIQ